MPERENGRRGAPLTPMTAEEQRRMRREQLSRRRFLQQSGGVATIAVAAGAAAAAQGTPPAVEEAAEAEEPFPYVFNGVQDAPQQPPPTEFRAFSEEQAAIVEALTARFIPGTPDDPGAREAGVVHYIDYILSTNSGIHEPTYTSGPWARTYEGDAPPEEDDEDIIWVKASEISRYGYQARLSPLQVYEIGLQAVHDYAWEQYGTSIPELSEEQQDEIVSALLNNEVPGFDEFAPVAFFHTLRRHTAEGMFCDPLYGGNRDMVGWRLVGFPGSQRAYSVEDLHDDQPPRPPQGLESLPHFHPGVVEPDDDRNVVQPVREAGEPGQHDGDTPVEEGVEERGED